MKPVRKSIIGAILILIILFAIYNFIFLADNIPDNIIRVSGNIEVTDAEVSFRVAGYVIERIVSEGDRIIQGDVVAYLDDAELQRDIDLRTAELQFARSSLAELEAGYRKEEIASAEASTRKARSFLDELLAGARPQEIAAAKATVNSARAEVDLLRAEYNRQLSLLEGKVISQQDFDRIKTQYERAVARLNEVEEHLKLLEEGARAEQIEQARAALAEAQARLELLQNGPRKEDIDRARASVEKSQAALAISQIRRDYATLRSPLTGIVLSDPVEAGEFVSAGTPVITIGDLERPWLRAYINETDLGRVKVGQSVRVMTDTFPDKVYPGVISFISSESEFTPKNVQTEEERVKLVYRIKIDIDNPDMELKPGMPADAEIILDD